MTKRGIPLVASLGIVGPMGATVRLANAQGLNRALHDQLGRITNAQGAAQRAHQRMAIRATENQHRILKDAVLERAARYPDSNRDTRHLRRAVRSSGNRRGLGRWVNGFEAGLPDFLDTTPAAPYWRQVEEGSSTFVGRQLLMVPHGTGLRDLTKKPGARGPRVTVQRAIKGHHFLEEGSKLTVQQLEGGLAFRIYRDEFRREGIKLSRFRGRTQLGRATAAARHLTQ